MCFIAISLHYAMCKLDMNSLYFMEPQFNAVHNFNSGLGNVLLPDGTKPLPEPIVVFSPGPCQW